MTTKESQKALKSYNDLDNLLWFHNKNLTNAQYETLSKVRDTLRELSQKAYELEKEQNDYDKAKKRVCQIISKSKSKQETK